MAGNPLEEIRQRSRQTTVKCAVSVALGHPEHGNTIQQAIDDPLCTDRATAEWARDQGIIVSANVISKHRRGGCACP